MTSRNTQVFVPVVTRMISPQEAITTEALLAPLNKIKIAVVVVRDVIVSVAVIFSELVT